MEKLIPGKVKCWNCGGDAYQIRGIEDGHLYYICSCGATTTELPDLRNTNEEEYYQLVRTLVNGGWSR